MTPEQNQQLQAVKKDVLDGMADALAHGATGYTHTHIVHCRKILDLFLAAMGQLQAPAAEETILGVVEDTVLRLNELNDECGHMLIDVDQRNPLCELILTAARCAGLPGDEDVTQAWREW